MDDGISRRLLLRSLPLAGGVALAGCNDGESGSPNGTDRPATDGSTEVRVTTTDPSTAGPTDTGTPSTATPGSPGGVVVQDLSVEPASVRQGRSVTVTVTLGNDGDETDVHPLRLRDDGGVLQRKRVSAAPGNAVEASFEVRCDRPGTRRFAAGDRTASVEVERWPREFVGVDGTSFALGGEPYPMVGTNNAYLHHKSPKTVEEVVRDAAAMGLNAIRVLVSGAGTEVGYCREFACGRSQYGLQPGPREYDEESFRKLDYVIAVARRHGVRIVPSLLTLSPGGIATYLEWVDGAETREDFFTNEECRAIYRDYLEQVLTRENTYTGVTYRDDPTVALWELVNEPELESRPFGQPLQDWMAEMAGHVKSVDPNHLVSAGFIGWTDQDNESDFLACFESDAVDAVSTHMYYDADGIEDWVDRHASGVHDRLGKPLYVGEFGWDATRTEDDYEQQLANRHDAFDRWFDQFERHDVAGSLFWFLLGHLDDGSRFPDHDGFGVYYPEDEETVAIVEEYARRRGAGGAR